MRCTRTRVTIVLGYPVERLEQYDETGRQLNSHFEVLDPHTGAVLASQASIRAAKRFVLVHELRTIRSKSAGDKSTEAA